MATEEDKVNTGAIGTLAVVGALAVLGIAAALTALVRTSTADLAAERGSYANLNSVRDLKAEQETALNAKPAWTEKDKGNLSIPISRAMEVVVDELKQDPNSATPYKPVDGGVEAAAATGDAGAEDTDAAAAESGDGGAQPENPAPPPGDAPQPQPEAPAPPPDPEEP